MSSHKQNAQHELEECVLVLAPLGRDAELAASALEEAGVCVEVCADLDEVVWRLNEPRGALLLAEEALSAAAMQRLLQIFEEQPAWSDVPVILLTSGGRVTQTSRNAVGLFGPRGNVTLLERPLRVMTLTSTVQVALKARRRQYEVRDLLHQREQVLSSIRDAFSMLDREWRYTYVNEQACILCRRPADKMLGRTIWELFPGTAGTDLEAQLRRAMEEQASLTFEYHHPPWQRWFTMRVYPSAEGISLLTCDISEQKHMEAVLQDSERRLHLALESAQLGMWYCDMPFGKIICDASCKRQYGLPPDAELDFDLFYSILHPDDRDPTRRAIECSVNDRTTYDVEYRTVHPGGEVRWIHAIGRAFYHDDGEPHRFDGITIDISERKETELQLERARQEAIEANRAKDHFLAALSHELRTPLTPVLMTVAALQQDAAIPQSAREDLERIHRQVELEARLIDDLLDLTRVTRGKLILHRAVLNVNVLLQHAIETCCDNELMQKELHISVRAEAAEHHISGDPARLHQVLCNLLSNAVKFTPHGGNIVLSTHNPQPQVVAITVADDGIGVAADLLPRLFDAFEQGHPAITRRFGGLGLGLAISKAIVDLHGGKLRAESDGRGKGAVITLELAAAPAPAMEAAADEPREPAVSRPLRILLTEDHEPTRSILSRLLKRAGHEVHTAGAVGDALEVAEKTSLDLLVSDLGLPDGSGVELMRELQARYGLQGIAISGYGMDDDVRASAEAGFALHLTKPVDWRRLEAALNAIGGKSGSGGSL